MDTSFSLLLILSFVVSLCALGVLVWAITHGHFFGGKAAARSIFDEGEEGLFDDPTVTYNYELHDFDVKRAGIDRTGKPIVTLMILVAVTFLVVGSIYGLVSSLKLHLPDFLTNSRFLTFGITRTVHLNFVNYGWLSVAALGIVMWTIPRIFRVPLRRPQAALIGGLLFAGGLTAGMVAVSLGWSDGVEWLEVPWQISIVIALGVALIAWSVISTAVHRQVEHMYVTAWYYLGALCWFPMLYIISKIPGIHWGVEQAALNWWFAHNVLGLWVTPMGIATAYYILPKVIGKPIFSYNLSILGFWSLALFYSQVGIHHLVGGPLPTWLVTLSIVHSMMMFIPVIAVAINQHGLMLTNWWAFKKSYVIKFVWIGALMYTASSFQGSLEALRSLNSITHFTHFTVVHAHLGGYGFITMIMMGAIYYIMPHLLQREWPCPKAIAWHFWLVVIGFFGFYFIFLTIGGWIQGSELLDPAKSFEQVTRRTEFYLIMRSIGGTLMTVGHIIFAVHVFMIVFKKEKVTATEEPRISGHTLAQEGGN